MDQTGVAIGELVLDLVEHHVEVIRKSADVPGLTRLRTSSMNSSSMPTSVSEPAPSVPGVCRYHGDCWRARLGLRSRRVGATAAVGRRDEAVWSWRLATSRSGCSLPRALAGADRPWRRGHERTGAAAARPPAGQRLISGYLENSRSETTSPTTRRSRGRLLSGVLGGIGLARDHSAEASASSLVVLAFLAVPASGGTLGIRAPAGFRRDLRPRVERA